MRCASLGRPLPGRLAFWALALSRQPPEHPVGLLQFFLEPVIFQDEVAVAVYDASPQPGINGFTTNAVLVCGVTDSKATVSYFEDYFIFNVLLSMFANRHTKTPSILPTLYCLLARQCVQYMGRVTTWFLQKIIKTLSGLQYAQKEFIRAWLNDDY